MQGGKLGKKLVHGPVELDAGHVPGNIGHGRKGVDDVAERGQPHQQDFFHGACAQSGASPRWHGYNPLFEASEL